MTTVDEPDFKLCRLTRGELDGDRSVLHMHYLVATPEHVRSFVERYNLAHLAPLRRGRRPAPRVPRGERPRGPRPDVLSK